MILKGSQRGGGQDLARHLLKMEDNEHVELHELRGFACDDLKGAFKEAEAVSLGTKCRQYLFSLSLSPPEDAKVSVEDFMAAIDRVEAHLGLDGQPRAVVFHEKEARRHAHVAWSRIDADSMTARPVSFFKNKLQAISRDLYLQHGWTMPRGIAQSGARDPTNFTLAEWQQAKRQGIDPRWSKAAIQDCWNRSDSGAAFASALQDRGFWLARGDRRAHVVLDYNGEVHALSRQLGLKTKDVKARLGDPDDLRSVDATKAEIGRRMTPAIRRHIEEARTKFQKNAAVLAHAKAEMVGRHRDARIALDKQQRRDWNAETRQRAARLPRGLAGVWHRITGRYGQVRALNEAEAEASRRRIADERQALSERQRDERRTLQLRIKDQRKAQAEKLSTLRADVGRFLKFSKAPERETQAPSRLRDAFAASAASAPAGVMAERASARGAGDGVANGRAASSLTAPDAPSADGPSRADRPSRQRTQTRSRGRGRGRGLKLGR